MTSSDAMQVLSLWPDVRLVSSTEIADRLCITRKEARKRKRTILALSCNKLDFAALRLGLSPAEVEAIGARNVLRAAQ